MIAYTGIWTQPIVMTLLTFAWRWLHPRDDIAAEEWFLFSAISVTLPLYIWTKNSIAKRNGKKKFGLFDAFNTSTNHYYMPSNKRAAMYPPIPKEMMKKKPSGIIFGKSNGRYVCEDIHDTIHSIIIGGSGSGKTSSIILPILLQNSDASILAVDIKGELSYKSRKRSDERVKIFNPNDRSMYGYDAFYLLNEESSGQQIFETMQNIANSLIAIPANLSDTFWKTSARNLLVGLMIFYYKQGEKDFVGIIDKILSQPISQSVADVMEKANEKSAEYRYIVQFSDMAEETLGGIVAEMNNHIVIFANDQDIRFAFKENAKKVNPTMLEDGYSIFLSISEDKLTEYNDVLRLILNQALAAFENRPEDSEPIHFIIDELPRVVSSGKLEKLLDAVKTLRSRNVKLIMVSQSNEALMAAYSENEVADLMSNCSNIIVLSATSVKTQKAICDWCGTYKERKQSISGSGAKRKVTISYEDKDIVEPSDLMELPNTGELILITSKGYMRVKKAPYYKDGYMREKAKEIVTYNNAFYKERTKI